MFDSLRGMVVFAKVVEHGSFSGAAKELGITTSAVSQQIRSLESDLGIVLLHRSTRKLSLTDAGISFYESATNVVQAAEQGWSRVNQLRDELAGTLRIATTPELGVNHLLPALSDWILQNDELNINILADNHYLDLIEQRVDIAIRMSPKLDNEQFEAFKLANVRQVLLASPDYLKNAAKIESPKDLCKHKMIGIDLIKEVNQLQLQDITTGKKTKVKIPSKISTNNVMLATDMAKNGHGIVRLLKLHADDYLKSGDLVEVLPNFKLADYVLYCITLKREQQPKKVIKCLDVLKSYFSKLS